MMYKQVKLFENIKNVRPDCDINAFLKAQGKYIITVHPFAFPTGYDYDRIDVLVEYYVHEKQSKESIEQFTQ